MLYYRLLLGVVFTNQIDSYTSFYTNPRRAKQALEKVLKFSNEPD
jgi:hypothetical protein